MGIVTMGVPSEIVLELAHLNESTVFIETGTYHGDTTRWAAEHFETVHTIERAQGLYDLHRDELLDLPGVMPHLGNSLDLLPAIIKCLNNQSTIYWLDGHWSGGETAGKEDECPLLDELACLAHLTNDIILIDDARLFLCPPPLPHDASQWPSIAEILDVLPQGDRRPLFQIVDDVIFIVPDKPHLRECLTRYGQERSKEYWNEFARVQRGTSSTIKKSQVLFRALAKRVIGLSL